MNNLLLIPLEKAINAYLKMDPETSNRLLELHGKIIKIQLTDWDIEFFITPMHNTLQFRAQENPPADVIIISKLPDLIKISKKNAATKDLFKNSLRAEGDLELGQKFRDVLQAIDVDWEEQLSQKIGDTGAHILNTGWKILTKNITSIKTSLRENTLKFLHNESRISPSKEELDNFYRNIGRLRDDVERIQVRIENLTQHKKRDE